MEQIPPLVFHKGNPRRIVGIENLEKLLEERARVYGAEDLNHFRDQSKSISKKLGLEKEFQKLN